MTVFLQLAMALAPVFAGWAAAASVAAIRLSRNDLAASAWRGLAAATACAVLATAGLTAGFVAHDFSMRLVAQASSEFMPLRYLPAAVLSVPGGALLALAAVSGLCGLVVAAAGGDAARRWGIATVAATLFVPLVVAAFADPFGVRAVQGDGAGLSPDLQRGAAVVHSVALLLGAGFATASFVETIAAVSARAVDDGWSRRVRRWNALAWTAIVVGVVAGARWYALNPVRGAWLEAPATALWLLPCAAGAWLLHLDTGRQDARRVATRLFLIAVVFIGVMVAVAAANGAFVNGMAQVERGHAGAWMGVVPAAALLLLVARLRRGAGVLRGIEGVGATPSSAAGAWVAHAGLVLLLAAVVGARFVRPHTVTLGDADIFRAKDPFGHQWKFASQGVSTLQRDNYGSLTVSVLPERDGTRLGMLSAEARSYLLADGEDAGGPDFTTGTITGLFMETRLTVPEPDGKRPTLRIAFVPLAPWVVVGTWLVAIGTLLPLFTRRDEVAT